MPEFDQEQKFRDGEEEKFCKLFIGGLNYTTTEDGLRGHFEQWGEIVDCVVMRDPVTKRSRGFGFVTYKTEEMLDEAQKNRPHKLDGREVDTKRAIPRNESDETQATVKKMFIGGLKDGTTEEEIKTKFETFGPIDKVEMIKDKNTGKQRGFCFVTYEDYDAVDKCVLRRRIQLNGKYVEVKKAVSKNDIERSSGGGRGGMRGDFGGRGRNNYDDYNSGGGGNWNMGGGNNWGNSGGYGGNQGGWNQGNQGGWNQGYGGGGNGGYGGGNFNQRGNFGGGYNQGNNFGGGGGGGDYTSNENIPAGETTADSPHLDKLSPTEYAYDNNWGTQNFGSGYGSGGNVGAMRGGNYAQRSSGPYGGGGYGGGSGGGGNMGGGGGGYNRR